MTTINKAKNLIKPIFMTRAGDIVFKMTGMKLLFCFGDSHVKVFEYIYKNKLFKKTFIRVVRVGGATAFGLANPNSKTNAFNIFRENLKRAPKWAYVLFMMGEVDCGFLIWYRAQKYGLDPYEQMELSIKNYTGFIMENVLKKGYRNVIICSAPLPTILDGQDWGEVANARREVKATLRERTDMTIEYNRRLQQFAEKHGIMFLNFQPYILNPKTMLVDDYFRNPDPLDHHLDDRKLAEVIVREMRKFGFR